MVGPVGYEDFAGFTHAFLIRDPARMIASYLRKREAAAFEDFGLERQAEFFEREADRLGEAPPVVDANDVLADPASDARQRCARALGIAWDPAMLRWPAGRRATDGPGRRIGTRRSKHRRASARPIPKPHSTTKRRGWPSAAGPIMKGLRRIGSRPDCASPRGRLSFGALSGGVREEPLSCQLPRPIRLRPPR